VLGVLDNVNRGGANTSGGWGDNQDLAGWEAPVLCPRL